MNAYDMMVEIRYNLDESTASHWTDLEILNKINRAYRSAVIKTMLADKSFFLTKSSLLAPSSNQLTLPTDCSKPVYLETSDGWPIEFNIPLENRRASRLVGTSLRTGDTDGYMLEDVIEINVDSFSDSCYLWYIRRVPDLHTCGPGDFADTGGVASISLTTAMNHSMTDDYYNNEKIEIIAGTGAKAVDTITDYTGATGVCVVTGTYGVDTTYGTVPQLPQEVDDLIISQATLMCMAKPSAAIDPKYFEYFGAMYRDARRDYEQWVETRVAASERVAVTMVE